MMFNSFLWGNYKESKDGKELISFFENYKKNIIDVENIKYYITLQNKVITVKDEDSDYEDYLKTVINVYKSLSNYFEKEKIDTKIESISKAEDMYRSIYNLFYLDQKGNKTSNRVFSSDDVPLVSEILYSLWPKYFFPYYFERTYHDLIEVFSEFGIFLPNSPKKIDSKGRFFHYFEICRSLHNFGEKNGLNEYELPAFVYGFALNVVKRFNISDVMPEPRRAYFVGGGKRDSTVDSSGDLDYLDTIDESSVSNWNGNPETQVGDIIVMYCLAPRSHIHSIWRAVSPGSYDPFFHYYKNVNIGKPIIVKPIAIEEIRKDSILSEMPLVKANMQGINGRNIPKKYYDRILELLEIKGQNIELLPKLSNDEIKAPALNNEKEVEQHLLEPLLKKKVIHKKIGFDR